MIDVQQTEDFRKWLHKLKDIQARALIHARIDRMRFGHFGDCKPVGNGVSELRVHCGAGYRVYFLQRGKTLVILLAGGNKSTQKRDIPAAILKASQIITEEP